jgi:CDP-4-dehydro-6-deoxyglucose reductase
MIDAARSSFTTTRGLPEEEFFADSFTYAAVAETTP